MLWRYGTGKPVSLSKTETQIPFGNDKQMGAGCETQIPFGNDKQME